MTLFLTIAVLFIVHLFLQWLAFYCGYAEGWEEGLSFGKVHGELSYRLDRIVEAIDDQD